MWTDLGLLFFLFSVLYMYFFVLIILALPFGLYCTTHTTQTSMPPAGFEPAIPVSDRPSTGIGEIIYIYPWAWGSVVVKALRY